MLWIIQIMMIGKSTKKNWDTEFREDIDVESAKIRAYQTFIKRQPQWLVTRLECDVYECLIEEEGQDEYGGLIQVGYDFSNLEGLTEYQFHELFWMLHMIEELDFLEQEILTSLHQEVMQYTCVN